MKCQRVNCDNEATYEVVLELRVHANHTAAISSPLVCICNEHKDIQWDDVVNDAGWEQICRGFTMAGKARPRRKYSNVKVQRMQVKQ